MIVRNKHTLNGKWRIEGTRISVETIINTLKRKGIDWVLYNYPTITIKDVADCLNFYVKNEEIIGSDINVGSIGGKQ